MDKGNFKGNFMNNARQAFSTISQHIAQYERITIDPSFSLADNKISNTNKSLDDNRISLESMEFITDKPNKESKSETMLNALKSDIEYLESLQDTEINFKKYYLQENTELSPKLNISELVRQCGTINIARIEEIELLKAEIKKNYK